MLRLPDPCLVVLVGPSGSGKSQWASEWFRPEQIVSSDRLRALVGESEHDQRAGTDAFAVLDVVLERRLKRNLFTVLDTLGLDDERRRGYVALARRHGVPVVAVGFDAAAADCRARNAKRDRSVPTKVLSTQLRQWPEVRDRLADDGFDAVYSGPSPVRTVNPQLLHATDSAQRQRTDPVPLKFGLYLGNFTWPGGPAELGPRLAALARTAVEVGFTGFWVMDHLVQIPQVGRHWEMLDSWTTLAFLAGHTDRATLGTLVTAVTFRNVALLGKILQLLPLMWGPGSPSFEGKTISVPEAICYPRPLQARVPILVGGSGERRTLRLAAQYGDACNLLGDTATVRHKVAVLHRHCADIDRDPTEVRVTHRTNILVADDPPSRLPERTIAGTVEEQIGYFRELAEAGVQTCMVRLADVVEPGAIERFAPVIAAFRRALPSSPPLAPYRDLDR